MSDDAPSRLGRKAADLLADHAWAQWSVLSAAASHRARAPQSTIDAEALVIQSIVVAPSEQRLVDVLRGWFHEGISLISLQRARSLIRQLPPRFHDVLGTLAAIATASGDHRWKRYVTENGAAHAARSREKKSGPLRLDAAGALMLRLRAGFGAGTKADVLALLLGQSEPMTLRAISDQLRYLPQPLRIALDDMVAAGFVERIGSSPVIFRASARQWENVLSGGFHEIARREDFPPPWLPWADTLICMACVIDWSMTAATERWSDYVAASRARDLMETSVTPAMVHLMNLRMPDTSGQWKLDMFARLFGSIDEFTRHNW